MKRKRPDIGTKMFTVWEHLYYIPEHAGPILEYVVCEGEVTGFFEGSWVDIELKGLNPNGYLTPDTRRLQDIGTDVFFTAREAAKLAQKKTEDYERIWGWVGSPDIPLRRTWEKYLKDMEEGAVND